MAAHNDSLHTPPTPIAMEACHGTHVFEVRNYSLHRGLCFGSILRSSTFRVGGCEWRRRAVLDSLYVAVGIELVTMDAAVTVSFGADLVDAATGARHPAVHPSAVGFDTRCVVGGLSQDWCANLVMRRSQLESSAFLRGDRVVIDCNLWVIAGTRWVPADAPPMAEVAVPPHQGTHLCRGRWRLRWEKMGTREGRRQHPAPPMLLLVLAAGWRGENEKHLGRMLLEEGDGADVTFEVQGESIRAHRAVVASRSPVFKEELQGLMQEHGEYRIAISDMQPDVFRALLRFIYTDSLPNTDPLSKGDSLEMTRHLLVAADRYGMHRLQLVCASILSKSLDVENVSATLDLADRHGCSALKDACIDYIIASKRMNDVARTEGYARLKRSCPSVFLEVLEKAGQLHKI
ncbi:unnamed protein product [Urochloa decumbens]|uniref:BTB domain-containing protein n=1 Tax=Urochloa decumbens TaxID=240449 RepID=A0ABC9BXF1_9POAL